MRVQEHHNVADGFLLGPAGGDPRRAKLPDPRHLPQPFRRRFDGFEGRHAEGGDNSPGELGTDASDHAGAEIFFDAFRRRRGRRLQKVGFELKAVSAIGDPDADSVNIFAGGDRSGVADDRHEVAFAARFDLQNGEPILLIVKSHAFDRADERFPRRGGIRWPFRLHGEAPPLRISAVGSKF
jgi:hypothetical protein